MLLLLDSMTESEALQISEQDFPEAEADFDLVVDCIKCARSVSSSYNLATNGKTIEEKITGVFIEICGAPFAADFGGRK